MNKRKYFIDRQEKEEEEEGIEENREIHLNGLSGLYLQFFVNETKKYQNFLESHKHFFHFSQVNILVYSRDPLI